MSASRRQNDAGQRQGYEHGRKSRPEDYPAYEERSNTYGADTDEKRVRTHHIPSKSGEVRSGGSEEKRDDEEYPAQRGGPLGGGRRVNFLEGLLTERI